MAKKPTVKGLLKGAALRGATDLVSTMQTPISRLQAITLAIAAWENGYRARAFSERRRLKKQGAV